MYLCVAEEKDDGIVFNASLQHDLLQIIMPLRQSVVLGQLDLKQVVLRTVHTTSRSAVIYRISSSIEASTRLVLEQCRHTSPAASIRDPDCI